MCGEVSFNFFAAGKRCHKIHIKNSGRKILASNLLLTSCLKLLKKNKLRGSGLGILLFQDNMVRQPFG
jgi:hypothetical protein